ncbi:hypothetical protein [Clostridium beijerinckii]|uniref:hypothetical protein n=1 Tax=Clostridium beijerinckii TaxID=1520 RepID=UPI00156F62FD|nr:hypothetical protein [Clostridium beijerinckii]NRU52539.1 putative Zn-dependent protease [Clostridium beijerinckii]NYC69284.1 putative Zn-dependent protease [Clostridium beijerinckii]NYC91740.1 putative Zn-dependent protease [Clostridium beijerinckii]
MLGLIVNEKIICEKALADKYIEGKPMKIIRLIIKKYLNEKLTKEQVFEKVDNFMKEIYKDKYNKSYWKKVISDSINTVSKYNNYNLINIEKIDIYKEELDIIESLNDIRLEKLAFVLLIYAKINKIINPTSDGRININLAYIFKESKLVSDKKLLHKLVDIQYILTSKICDSTTMKINYINEEGEVRLTVFNLNDLNPITYYLEYKLNETYNNCEICASRFKQKSKKPRKYCNKCAKEIDKEKAKERMKNIRNFQ